MKEAKKTDPSKSSLVKVKWIDGLKFIATDNVGHSIIMDASKQSAGGGSGFSPMQLLLVALGGCTGMDVIHIMRKQRQQISNLEILVSGRRAEEPPRAYDSVHVDYKIRGKNIKENKVQRAIQLSEDRYCSVGATLQAKTKVTSNYVIE